MITIRRWHAYLGLLIAPSVLFFSLTGAVQLFGLHEGHGSYQPPALIEKLSSVHQHQEFALGHHGPPPGAAGAAGAADAADHHEDDADHHDDHDQGDLSTKLLKWFFLIVSLALAASTCLGVWMGLTQMRGQSLAWTLLLIGTVVPVALLLL